MTRNRNGVALVRPGASGRGIGAHTSGHLLSSSAYNRPAFKAPRRSATLSSAALVARCTGESLLVSIAMLLVCFLVRALFVESFFVPSVSMMPTLRTRDHVVVAKLAYGLQLPVLRGRLVTWDSPRRGEVIVFKRKDDPRTHVDESARSMVKRVIGVAGDTVILEGVQVLVNGQPLSEPYARWSKGGIEESKVFVVPYGALFVLGDNRDESSDSRSWSDPFVDEERVVGPVAAVY